jgi:hypothetical protein
MFNLGIRRAYTGRHSMSHLSLPSLFLKLCHLCRIARAHVRCHWAILDHVKPKKFNGDRLTRFWTYSTALRRQLRIVDQPLRPGQNRRFPPSRSTVVSVLGCSYKSFNADSHNAWTGPFWSTTIDCRSRAPMYEQPSTALASHMVVGDGH